MFLLSIKWGTGHITTTGCSVPILRIGTFVLAGPPLGVFPWHRRTGSQVLGRSLCHVHAAFMPVTIWTVNRFPPDLSRANDSLPVLMTSLRFRQFISGSLVFVSIGTHLTRSRLAFSVTLTTMAFDHSSLRRFGASTCMAAPRGPPSSSAKHGLGLSSSPAPSWRTIICKSMIVHRFIVAICRFAADGIEHPIHFA